LSSNVFYMVGVINTQNTWISSNAAFTQSAFNLANSSAKISGWSSNTLLFANSTGYISNSGINYFTGNNTIQLPATTTFTTTGNVIFSDASFLLQNSIDPTKFARILTANPLTGTTVVYTLPAGSGNVSSLVDSQTTQTISGAKTFSGAFVASSTVTFNGTTTAIGIGTSATTGTTTIGGATTTGTILIGQSTGAQSLSLHTGATTSGTTKTINLGTAGLANSTTTLTIGSAVSGSKGTTTIQTPNVFITAANTAQSTVSLAGTLSVGGVIGGPSPLITIPSSGTISPNSLYCFVSGTTAISNITVPSIFASGSCQLVLIPTGLWSTNTAGNIVLASTAIVNKALIMVYDSGTNKWYPSY